MSRSGRRGDRVRARSPRRGPLLLPPATATGGQLQVEIIGGGGGIRRCDGMEERTRRRDLVCVDEHGNANAAVEEEEERTAPPENESEMEATPLSLSLRRLRRRRRLSPSPAALHLTASGELTKGPHESVRESARWPPPIMFAWELF